MRNIALWLSFECRTIEGESERAAQRRAEAEAKRLWPESTPEDFDRAQVLAGDALELSNAMLERGVNGHKIH